MKNLKPLEMEEIKKIELNILTEFADFCKKNDLKYYLGYGTLLGAVRHKGFIPWDDDIDVLMPRPDYNRFVELTGFNPIKENLETRLYKACLHPNIYPFAKLIDNSTIVFEKGKSKKNISGLWIDIFPLDGYPEDKSKAYALFDKYQRLRKLQDLATTNPFYINQSLIKKIIKTLILSPAAKLYGIKKLCAKINLLAQTFSYEDSKALADFTWGDSRDCYLLKEELEPAVELQFENRTFKAPASYDLYLKRLYGDYMQLPPENERVSHGMKAFISK